MSLTHGAEFLRSWQFLSYSRNIPPFTTPEGSWPFTTGSYSEIDEYSPCLPHYFFMINFNIVSIYYFPQKNVSYMENVDGRKAVLDMNIPALNTRNANAKRPTWIPNSRQILLEHTQKTYFYYSVNQIIIEMKIAPKRIKIIKYSIHTKSLNIFHKN